MLTGSHESSHEMMIQYLPGSGCLPGVLLIILRLESILFHMIYDLTPGILSTASIYIKFHILLEVLQ